MDRLDCTAAPQAEPGGLPGGQLRPALEHTEANVLRGPRLDELGRLVHMSAFHFARLFKASTGLPPHRFVVMRRIEHAKQMLACAADSIAAIGRVVGFRTASHFTSAFRRVAGVTPSG